MNDTPEIRTGQLDPPIPYLYASLSEQLNDLRLELSTQSRAIPSDIRAIKNRLHVALQRIVDAIKIARQKRILEPDDADPILAELEELHKKGYRWSPSETSENSTTSNPDSATQSKSTQRSSKRSS